MDTATILFLALLLDAVSGEPNWLWDRITHPAVLMGKLIGWADETFNTGNQQRNGVLLIAALVVGAWMLGAVIASIGWLPNLLLTAILIAQRSLVDHVKEVATGLRRSLKDGHNAVAKIVGRDTGDMDQAAVSRAAIESGAENLSDGVIAPAFWYLIFGLPGLLVYKVVNTADSMIGYRTPRHEDFGWAAAKFDDLLNWIPARLTAVLIAVTHRVFDQWAQISDDAALHRSPNAGWPEAAMAISLDVALSGPRSYDGEMRDFPYVNTAGAQEIDANEIDQACSALWRSWALGMLIVGVFALF